MPTTPTPTDLAVSRHRGVCTITWSDGLVVDLPLVDLRRACPCATCREQREQQQQGNNLLVLHGSGPTADLDGLETVGGYALKPVWADGHATGIYPYDYLRRLCEEAGPTGPTT